LNRTQNVQPVDAMARAACFSRRQFHRLMVQLLGETPGSHQRRLRLDRAAWLLLMSRLAVLDIALETGFESHETLSGLSAPALARRLLPFAKIAARPCRDRSGPGFPLRLRRLSEEHSGRRLSAATTAYGDPGGPATSLLRVAFSGRSKTATLMDVTDSTFGCLGDPSATEEGWRTLFEGGFKKWVEGKR
jgi:AraC-like DNA-binding protein